MAKPQITQVAGVHGGGGDPPVDASMQPDEGAIVTPFFQIVVEIAQHGGGGVVVTRVAAQLELGQRGRTSSRLCQSRRGVLICT